MARPRVFNPLFVYLAIPFFLTLGATCSRAFPADLRQPLHTIHIVPQSHIDVVWLWRYDPETIHRCCKVTFSQALENMDRFPEYTFSQSQVPLYEPLEKIYPEIWRRIQEHIRAGRWEVAGGMYVEAEGGEPGGESWARQCVMGKRWFKTYLGVDVKNGWQADAWGHPAQLPQILAKSGMTAYLWRRGDAFGPRHAVQEKLFWWEAPDHSKVLAWRFVDPEDPPYPQWREEVRVSRERYGLNDTLIVIGRGDHGGGPTAKDIEITQEFARQAAPDYKVQFSTFSRYIEAVTRQNPRLPAFQGDLGFELNADLTNVCEIKKNNRERENQLLTSEKWATLAARLFHYEYPKAELDEAWKKLLFNQFHDILGGSLIPEAVQDAMRLYQSVRDTCETTCRQALEAIGKNVDTRGEGVPIVVFNPLSWIRTGAVEVELVYDHIPEHITVLDSQGNSAPLQIVEKTTGKGPYRLRGVFLAREVPSLGYKTYHAVETATPPGPRTPLSVEGADLENEFFRIGIDPQSGCVRQIFDKKNHHEVFDASGRGNQLVAIEDEGDSEGRYALRSDLAAKPSGPARDLDTVDRFQIVENGPVRIVARVEKKYQNSRFTQDIILYAGRDQVEFLLTVDWHDIHRLIKIAFPYALSAPEATWDAPYGTSVRPADGIDYPAQKWVDLYAEGYGAALLNNARYAHDVEKNVLRMNVLRSPTQPAYNTDEGLHTLEYALYPHAGRWDQARVMQKGYEFNYPLTAVTPTAHEGSWPPEKSFLAVEPEEVILEVVKQADESDQTVLRLCEMNGREETVRLTLPRAARSARETDLLEKPLAELRPDGDTLEFPIGPHEIKTVTVYFIGENG